MDSATSIPKPAEPDVPQRIQPGPLAERYKVSPRTGGEWIRAMLAQGVLRKVRSIIVGRWSAIDAWVEAGGKVPEPAGRRVAPIRGPRG
jgi:hypothetical protein